MQLAIYDGLFSSTKEQRSIQERVGAMWVAQPTKIKFRAQLAQVASRGTMTANPLEEGEKDNLICLTRWRDEHEKRRKDALGRTVCSA